MELPDELWEAEETIREEYHQLSGTEPFVIGLSPSFWAHVPLLITHLLNDVRLDENSNVFLLHQHHNDASRAKTYPVSKCKLVGWIVAADHKGSRHLYTLDDGTGLIDCLYWTEDEDILPPLVPNSPVDDEFSTLLYDLGDLVRIMGKMVVSPESLAGGTAIQELHVVSIQRATPQEEMEHWKHCLDDSLSTLTHPKEILDSLSPSLQQQVAERTNMPSADDTVGAWRLFGVKCPCKGKVKDELLYCTCIACPEPLDIQFDYRMSLLEELLKWLDESTTALEFPYQSVRTHDRLYKVATDVAPQAPVRLLETTFAALRKDGILYLANETEDTYLLLSKKEVLEPCTAASMNRQSHQDKPPFLANVPSARLQFVRRSLLHEKRKNPPTHDGSCPHSFPP